MRTFLIIDQSQKPNKTVEKYRTSGPVSDAINRTRELLDDSNSLVLMEITDNKIAIIGVYSKDGRYENTNR
jgi:hypothetical protein